MCVSEGKITILQQWIVHKYEKIKSVQQTHENNNSNETNKDTQKQLDQRINLRRQHHIKQ